MPAGEDEAVAVGPLRMRGRVVVVEEPEGRGDVGHAHGQTGMSGFGGLHAVGGEAADGVGGKGQFGNVDFRHGALPRMSVQSGKYAKSAGISQPRIENFRGKGRPLPRGVV